MGVLEQEMFISLTDFEAFSEGKSETLEWIEGQVYALASPSYAHQQVSQYLTSRFFQYFRKKQCSSVPAPFDIKLTKEGLDDQLVIPDLSVICDKEGLNEKRYEGVPSLVVEILSPSNQHHDLVIKMNLYAKFGVKEYWIVNPMNQSISIYTLDESQHYIQDIVKTNGIVESKLFSGLDVELEDLFEF